MVDRYRLGVIFAVVVAISVVATYEALSIGPFSGSLTSGTMTVSSCDTKVSFDGTSYCALDVSGSSEAGVQRYANMNQSVRFMGVLFQTICPANNEGCPGTGSVTTVVLLGIIQLNVTFSDGTGEIVSTVFTGCPPGPHLTTQHLSPSAGFYFNCSAGYPKLVLLVKAS